MEISFKTYGTRGIIMTLVEALMLALFFGILIARLLEKLGIWVD